MTRGMTLIRNIMIYAIGNLSSKILSFILLPFYTYYLSVHDYGYFDLISTTMFLLTPILTFQIGDGLFRFLLDCTDDHDVKSVVTNSFIVIVRNLVFVSILSFFALYYIELRFKYLILTNLNISVLCLFWMQVARGKRLNSIYSIAGVISTLVMLSANAVLIIGFKMKVDALIYSSILSSIAAILYLEYKTKVIRYIDFNLINQTVKKKLVHYSIPLIPNVISWWAMNFFNRYLLNFYYGTEANGIFAVANKFPSILMMVSSLFYLAWQETAILEYDAKDKDKFYSKVFNIYMVLSFTAVIGLLAVTKPVMAVMVNEKFNSAWMYVPLLYFGALFNSFSSFYGTGFMSSKDTKGALYSSLAGAMVNIVSNFIFIPLAGIHGASSSVLLGFLTMFLLRVKQTRKYFTISIERTKFVILIIISIVYLVGYYFTNKYVTYVLAAGSISIFVYFNKELMYRSFNYVKSKFS